MYCQTHTCQVPTAMAEASMGWNENGCAQRFALYSQMYAASKHTGII